MTLKELKKMIAEEYTAYKKRKKLNEQPAPAGMDDLPGVSVSDADVDATGGGDAESVLKDIMAMIEDFMQGGDEEDDAGGAEDEAEDVEGEEDEEADLEELKNHGFGGASAKKSSGTKGGGAYTKNLKEAAFKRKKMLSEIKTKAFKSRLKKLANI